MSLRGAKGVLINITGGKDLTLYEVEEAASLIRGQVDPMARIIVGSSLNPDLEGVVRVSVVATGVFEDENGPIVDQGYTSYTPQAAIAVNPKPQEETRVMTPAVSDSRPAYSPSVASSAPAYATYATYSREKAAAEAAKLAQPVSSAPPPIAQPEVAPAPVGQSSVAQHPVAQAAVAPVRAPAATARSAVPEAVPSAAQASVFRNTFNLWGRKKTTPAPQQSSVRQTPLTARPSGDLFASEREEELEIPSFLRRQNR